MSGITPKDHLDYAWKHFALIADQRVKTFNFSDSTGLQVSGS